LFTGASGASNNGLRENRYTLRMGTRDTRQEVDEVAGQPVQDQYIYMKSNWNFVLEKVLFSRVQNKEERRKNACAYARKNSESNQSRAAICSLALPV